MHRAWRMIRWRARDGGLDAEICCHTFRAAGITAYLDNNGTLENAQAMAAHESPRTTKLCKHFRQGSVVDGGAAQMAHVRPLCE